MGYGSEPMVEMNVTVSLSMENVIQTFHGVYYSKVTGLTWFGVPVMKCPIDMWIYQELLCRTLPDCIVETGTAFGGSALFMAMVCQFLGRGRVVSVDIKPVEHRPEHPLIRYLTGSSTDPAIIEEVRQQLQPGERTMVILDSDHAEDHVAAELEAYGALVTPACYLVVEDTNLNGHPVGTAHGPGPWEAVEAWLPKHPEFERDDEIEQRHVMTFNPGGYLRRRA